MTQLALGGTLSNPGVVNTLVVMRLSKAWSAPHGVLPMIRAQIEVLAPDFRVESPTDLLVGLDVLKGASMADHPEVARMALVELEYGGHRVRKGRWMSIHRSDTIAYARQRTGTIWRAARHAGISESAVGDICKRRKAAGFPGDVGLRHIRRWDGTVWGSWDRKDDARDPLRAPWDMDITSTETP